MSDAAEKAGAEIVGFSPAYAADFARLNYRWIEEYFSVEPHDRDILDDPQEFVIAPGGEIFIALIDGQAAGTVAMIPAGNGVFELTKMAVDPEFQRRGIADLLMQACVDFAVRAGAETVYLESHRKLAPALALYRKFGFLETPTDPNSEYARVDIRMELAVRPQDM